MAYTTIDDPSAYFQTIIYTGNNTSRSLTNTGNSDLQPDLIWQKGRDIVSDHGLIDSSRGVRQVLWANQTSQEVTSNSGADITAFNSDGFSVGTSHQIDSNSNTKLLVAWQWKCNGGTEETTVTESGNNPGNTRQTNTTAGFSIIKYVGTGAAGTIAHGLGATPEFIIHKSRDGGTENWPCYHIGTGNTHACDLNRNNAKIDNDSLFNDTSPTSSVFTVNSDSAINEDGDNCIAYAWTPIQGYSKFGSYTGNGDADGPFIYTGFKPAWFMLKRTDSSNDWIIFDNKRDAYQNPFADYLFANSNAAENADTARGDFLSNGVKIRSSANAFNASSGTYIYMAFAEHPFVSSKGVPVTAK